MDRARSLKRVSMGILWLCGGKEYHMFWVNLRRAVLFGCATVQVIESLERRTMLAASCTVDPSNQMQILGDTGANIILIVVSSGLVTAKESGAPMTNCNGRSGIQTLTAALGAGNDSLDASALPFGIRTTLLGEGGDDTLQGGADIDSLVGSTGNDSLVGNDNADTI